MAEKSTIARPYAKALFAHARGRGVLAECSTILEAGAAVVADSRVKKLLISPHLPPAKLAELIAELITVALGTKALDEPARNFLRVLAANRRLGLLPQIADLFARLRAEAENAVEVTVTSATPLNESQRQQYARALKERLRREVRLSYHIDPALLGGAILRAGDLVIDGSLRGRLQRLNAAVAG